MPESHIGNSRNDSFLLQIMKLTDGKGVNLVLNSLAAEKLQISIQCLSVRGRFLELGKFDLVNNESLGEYKEYLLT